MQFLAYELKETIKTARKKARKQCRNNSYLKFRDAFETELNSGFDDYSYQLPGYLHSGGIVQDEFTALETSSEVTFETTGLTLITTMRYISECAKGPLSMLMEMVCTFKLNRAGVLKVSIISNAIEPETNPTEGDTWSYKDKSGTIWKYQYSKGKGWVGIGASVDMPEVYCATRNYSGTVPFPENPKSIVPPPAKLSTAASVFTNSANIMKKMPVTGDMYSFYKMETSSGLSSTPNMASLVLPQLKPFRKVNGFSDLFSISQSMADASFNNSDIGLESQVIFDQINSDSVYSEEITNKINYYNQRPNSKIIIVYTDEEVDVGDMFVSEKELKPTGYARWTEELNSGFEYNGWKFKYAVYGLQDEFNGTSFPIRAKNIIDYEE